MPRKIKEIDPKSSFHIIKDMVQLGHTEKQTDSVTENIVSILEATTSAAPNGRLADQDYLQNRERGKIKNADAPLHESDWERACYWQWQEKCFQLPTEVVFQNIVNYQVPLKQSHSDDGWGKIDLIGRSTNGCPVVIELKSSKREQLLRAIAEAVAYGVAIKKAWNAPDSQIKSEWVKKVMLKGCLDKMEICPLVIAAPTEYWDVCLCKAKKRQPFQTPLSAIPKIQKLIATLRERGYPLSLVEITHNGQDLRDAYGLPVITGAKVRELS